MAARRLSKKKRERTEKEEKKKVVAEKKDIRLKFNEFINNVIEKGKTSSIRFDANFLKELEQAGEESRMKRRAKPVKIMKSKILTKPAITQALNLASSLEVASKEGAPPDFKKWVTGGK